MNVRIIVWMGQQIVEIFEQPLYTEKGYHSKVFTDHMACALLEKRKYSDGKVTVEEVPE